MNTMCDEIQGHLNEVLSKYLFESLNENAINKIQEKVKSVLFSLLEDSYYNELISIKTFKNDINNITIQPDNLFTLMYIHTGKIPPTMFMHNRGIEKDKFQWDGFMYSFVYDVKLGIYIPKIEEL